jgi:membrane protein DedA with SNARE-associated domain
MLQELIVLWFSWIEEFGYVAVFGLMLIESSLVPLPSEIVIPPASYWASQGKMNFWLVVLAGTLGSYAGSWLNYMAARLLGRRFLEKWGPWFGLSPARLEALEVWIREHGFGAIFIGRLLPVVRHIISLPAGALQMSQLSFFLATTTGAALWCTVLAWFGGRVLGAYPNLLKEPNGLILAVKQDLAFFVLGVLVFLGLWLWVQFRVLGRRKPSYNKGK